MFVDLINPPAHTYQITDIVIQFHVVEPLLQRMKYFPYFLPNSTNGLCQRNLFLLLLGKVVIKVAEGPEIIGRVSLFLILAVQQVAAADHIENIIDARGAFIAGGIEKEPELIGLERVFDDIPLHGYFLLPKSDFIIVAATKIGFVQQQGLDQLGIGQ